MNVIPLTYLGSIEYYAILCNTDCVIDLHENYVKQTNRNRCRILSANGTSCLTVNVVKGGSQHKKPVRDIRIDYSKRWQHQHWGALVSSYRNSPFFDYYAPYFEPFYTKRFDFLADLNIALTETVIKLLTTKTSLKFSESYLETEEDNNLNDLRSILSENGVCNVLTGFTPQPYWQVFSDRIDFVPNLSIADLLFCAGPSSAEILRNSLSNEPK